MKVKFFISLLLLLASANLAIAQTTEFTYQGRLVDGALPANASYDLEFKLFDVETGGTALGTTQRPGVPVSNGIFTVRLDFGANFNGGPRSGVFSTEDRSRPLYCAVKNFFLK
ncbi:MAG: hypothetical protein ABI646_01145 [Acidobacteriota bacterium]